MMAVLWPSMMADWPTMSGRPPKRRCQSAWLRTMVGSAPLQILGRRMEPAEQGLHAQRLKRRRRDAMAGQALGGKPARVIGEVDLPREVIGPDRVEGLGMVPQHEEHRRR